MRKLLILVCLFFVLLPIYAQTSIEYQVGDEIIKFNIPDTYAELRRYYMILIETYVESENKNLELTNYIKDIDTRTSALVAQTHLLQQNILTIENEFNIYAKNVNKFGWYIGGLLGYGYNLTLHESSSMMIVGPILGLGNRKILIQLAPFVSYATNYLSITPGILGSVTYRLSN